MQTWVLQSCVLFPAPEQSAPPYWGEGLEQLRKRSWDPPPHVTVQEPQLSQVAQAPSTAKNTQIFFLLSVELGHFLTLFLQICNG